MIRIAETIQTDVLVVGAGGAGLRAALEAQAAGAHTLLVAKGKLGRSGTTSFEVAETAGYNAADGCIGSDSPAHHYQDIIDAALGTCDPELARILAEEAPRSLVELESWGVPFEKKDGHHLVVEGCFASRPRMHIIKRHSVPILEVLTERLRAADVNVLEEVMVVDLLTQDGACVGALLIDTAGRYLLVEASAVILACGGAGQLFERNLNPSDITGDGYALALRAGAELINMEFMQAGLGLVYPEPNILNCWVWFLHPRLYNSRGEEFLTKYLPPGVTPEDCMNDKARHFPFSSRDHSKYIEYAVIQEINAGNTGPHGGVFLDFRQVDLTRLSPDFEVMWETTKNWFRQRGVDPESEPLEIAPFGHAINGGLRIDANGESSIKNLFAAGEVAGGPHGADRLGGNMIVGCQVFGRRAGRAAAATALNNPRPVAVDPTGSSLELVDKLSRGQGKLEPHRVKEQLQRLMQANYLIVKNEHGLRHLIEELQGLVSQLDVEGYQAASPAEVMQVLECRNMLQTAMVMAQAAHIRKESRGSHFRADIPECKPEFEGITVFTMEQNQLKWRSWNPGR